MLINAQFGTRPNKVGDSTLHFMKTEKRNRWHAWLSARLKARATGRWLYLGLFATGALVASQIVADAPAAVAAGAPTPYVYHQGFDTCESLTTGDLLAWWQSTPNWTVGLYLGGEDGAAVGCTGLGSGVWNYALNLGYGVEGFWYGAQMPTSCGGATGRPAYISLNDSTATTEGENEAKAAASAAASYGLPASAPIYADLEGFANNSGCLAAAQSFVNGWSYEMNNLTAYAGDLYGSSCSSYLGNMTAHSNVPRAIAPDDSGVDVTGVYGLQCLADNLWDHNQRVHQTENQLYHVFNGVGLYVDEDCADGPLISSVGPPTATSCGAPY